MSAPRSCPRCGASLAFTLSGRAWIPVLAADAHLLKRSPKGALFYHRSVATHFAAECGVPTTDDRRRLDEVLAVNARLRARVAELEDMQRRHEDCDQRLMAAFAGRKVQA